MLEAIARMGGAPKCVFSNNPCGEKLYYFHLFGRPGKKLLLKLQLDGYLKNPAPEMGNKFRTSERVFHNSRELSTD
jgi:hypothetical protein